MDDEAYQSTVRSLGVSIFLLELAIAGTALLFIFTLQDSVKVLSILGIWDKDFGATLWMIWPIVALPIAAVAWAEFVFIPRARRLLVGGYRSEKFGKSTADELAEINELRGIVNKYAIFLLAECILIAVFFTVPFLNVLLAGFLMVSLLFLLSFFREKARTLKAEKELLS